LAGRLAGRLGRLKACRISFRQVRTFEVSTFEVSTFEVSTFEVSTFEVSTLSGRPANIGEENVDVSIRLGEIRDKSLIARRLGSAVRLLYGSPSYLARRGVPNLPSDLGAHDCILQSYMARPSVWRLVSGKRSVDVDVRGRFSTNNVSMTLRFAEQGLG
jgi:DNA-binding transcriptional LysR family regulator